VAEVFSRLNASNEGLSSEEAARRLLAIGRNELAGQRTESRLLAVWTQLRSPLLLLLVFAAAVSLSMGQWVDAIIVLVILGASVGIGASREYGAQAAVAALRARTHIRTSAIRDGSPVTLPVEEVVPGDIVILSAGMIVPADAVVLEASTCFVSESALTGESFPVEKEPGLAAADAPVANRTGCVFLGTNVRSGSARCLVVDTGTATQFGEIADRLTLRPPATEFDRGILRFGYLLTIAMLTMVLLVFVANVLAGRPPVDVLLFAVALAVGLSPELLPAILSVNLARGAQLMAKRGVLVRRLNAIENLGSMDILCTDKTGTLTEGAVEVQGAYDASGNASADVLDLAARNAALESGLENPLDEAISRSHRPDLAGVTKLAEIPFDAIRKRMSVVVRDAGGVRLITKGAFDHVVEICTSTSDGRPLDERVRAELQERYRGWSTQGLRVLAIATRALGDGADFTREDEKELAFAGFVVFLDRPKEGVAQALVDLAKLGVSVKLITGDNRLVAQHVAELVGMRADRMVTGRDLDRLHDGALWHAAETADLFVEVDPSQKERIILALKKLGHVVGFMGDGVNDAPAMHAADTSLSVEGAVDVARAAADFVLLERDLDVIRGGIEEGRTTFANTLKYVLTTTSANLGNMTSMAVASLFLPFLPLLASQILLNNFLSDIPAIGIAGDSVDPELIERPRRWDMKLLARFMVEFGLLSSAFDMLTFATLLALFHAQPPEFRTGWFVQSLISELFIALVVRTQRPFYRSRPGRLLLVLTLALAALAFVIPYLPYTHLLGFTPLPLPLLAAVAGITGLYIGAAELTKKWFYRDRARR
jgi:Mg2+-importing ATPase